MTSLNATINTEWFPTVHLYLAPNTSLDKFLKAFDTKVQKGTFPHKVTQNLTKYLEDHPELKQYSDKVIQVLKNSPIPSKNWFYNDLKDVPEILWFETLELVCWVSSIVF